MKAWLAEQGNERFHLELRVLYAARHSKPMLCSISAVRISLVLLLLLAVAALALFAFSATPVVTLPSNLATLGRSTPVSVHVSDPHGVKYLKAWVEQNGTPYAAWETNEPVRRVQWARHVADRDWTFTAGSRQAPQLKDGKARLIVEAASNDFRGKITRAEREVTIVTQAPMVP